MSRRTFSSLWFTLSMLGLLLALTLLPRSTPTAVAHPLGNFTINLYSRLAVGTEVVDLTYVVDMAEIPTFQEFGGGPLDAEEQTDYLARKATELQAGLRLLADGQAHDLTLTEQALSFPAGQGGLATTRIDLQFTARLPKLAAGTQRAIAYEDTNYADRLGWHEVVVQPGPGANLLQSDVPAQDLSDELRVYPDDMLSSPRDVRAAQVVIAPGGSAAMPKPATDRDLTAASSDRFAALIMTEQLSPSVLLLALMAALGLGAVHALSPGHGKTIVGAYLVGARGTARHALFLGLTVTTTHTLGVFVLGVITLYASRYILPEQLYPWLGVLSGAMIVVMGLTLFRQRLRGARSALQRHHDHEHAHEHEHDHEHHHAHNHEHHVFGHVHGPDTHTHVMPGADGSPVSWRSLLALGISGGLIPCPSALLVMLSAIALGRVGFGLLLIVAFSLGLAGVLTGIGLLFVYSSRWIGRLSSGRIRQFGPALRLLPVASALFVTTAGLIITGQAVIQTGLLR